MKKILYYGIIISLVTFIGISSYKFFDFSNINNQKVNITIKDNLVSNNNSTLAIQIQDGSDPSDPYKWFEAKDRTKWPDKATYTYAGTECTDSEGAGIKSTDVLTFDETTYTATVNTKNSVYCTLFFAKGRPALEVMRKYQQGNEAQTFQSSAVAELIRYKGTATQVNNNYICFGTNNKDTCLAQPGTYMFRIIGIQAAENTNLGIPKDSLKIIKASKYGGNVKWNGSSGATWDTASVNTSTLNTYYNSISTTNSGVNWKNLILQNHYWYIGESTSSTTTTENTTKSTTNKPTGLMYKSDYINANGEAKTNWLFIQNGWSGNAADTEWTMSRLDNDWAWNVFSDGYLYGGSMDGTLAVRPVFYLISGIALVGSGTSTDPFIITNKA